MAYDGSGGAWYRTANSYPSNLGFRDACTIHLFFRTNANSSTANFRGVLNFRDTTNTNPSAHQFAWNHTSAGYDRALNRAPTYNAARLPSNPALDTWHSLVGRDDGTNIKTFLNGSEEASAARGTAGSDNARHLAVLALINELGALDSSSQWSGGMVGEVAVWRAALDVAEISALAKGFRATRIRPQSLYGYWPLVRGLQDIRGGVDFVRQAGTDAVVNHPRVFG